MAQLKSDEWPDDNEPTTTESEVSALKKKEQRLPGRPTGRPVEEVADKERDADDRPISNAPPDDAGD